MTYVIAHRGLSARLPENTLAAFEASLAHTAVLEVDVRSTRDGVAVCTHDISLERTHGLPRPIRELDFAELRALAPDVPRLEELIDAIGTRAGWFFDTKDPTVRIQDEILRITKKAGISLDTGELLRAGRPLPVGTGAFEAAEIDALRAFRARTHSGTALIVKSKSPSVLLELTDGVSQYADAVVINERLASKRAIRLLKAEGVGTYVYTVNCTLRYEELRAYGASAIFTDVSDAVGIRVDWPADAEDLSG